VGGESTTWDLARGRMCGWEERAQNEIWREAECVGGRREHKMGFGGRQKVWMGRRSTKWDLAGGRWMCGWEEGAQKGGGGTVAGLEREWERAKEWVSIGGRMCRYSLGGLEMEG
jgi:hypothetical protein